MATHCSWGLMRDRGATVQRAPRHVYVSGLHVSCPAVRLFTAGEPVFGIVFGRARRIRPQCSRLSWVCPSGETLMVEARYSSPRSTVKSVFAGASEFILLAPLSLSFLPCPSSFTCTQEMQPSHLHIEPRACVRLWLSSACFRSPESSIEVQMLFLRRTIDASLLRTTDEIGVFGRCH